MPLKKYNLLPNKITLGKDIKKLPPKTERKLSPISYGIVNYFAK
jgi:hypothetical protein